MHAAADLGSARAQVFGPGLEGARAANVPHLEALPVGGVGHHDPAPFGLGRVRAAALVHAEQAFSLAFATDHGFLAVEAVPATAQSVAQVSFRHGGCAWCA